MSKILNVNGTPENGKVREIKAIHPFGSTVLVENLTSQEMMGTKLYVADEAKTHGAPQAYVVELGPSLKSDCGIKVGDRVVVQGNFIPVINTTGNGRSRGILELHNIKAVIEEEN